MKRWLVRITAIILCALFSLGLFSCELTLPGKVSPAPPPAPTAVTVVFDGNGATGGIMEDLQTEIGETVTLPENAFVKAGHDFMGWSKEWDGEIDYQAGGEYLQDTAGVHTLYAVWESNDMQLRYTLTAGEYAVSGYKGKAKSVIIPAQYNNHPVVYVDQDAFKDADFLEEVWIEEGVLSVVSGAFVGCTSLKKLRLPDSLLSISEGALKDTAFYKDEKNWDLGVLYAGKHLIKAKNTLSGTYAIKDGTLSVGARAFTGCAYLTGVEIPQSVVSLNATALDDTAFYNDRRNWESNVLYVGDYLIKGQPGVVGSYTVKEETRKIASGAFAGCARLQEVYLPASLNIVGSSAFVASGLTRAVFENGLEELGRKAFKGCEYLTDVTLPESLKSIGMGAFDGCLALENLRIPTGVTEIGPRALSGCAFTQITLPEGITRINAETFANCPLEEIAFPDSLVYIGHSAFYNTALTQVEIPDSVTSLGAYVFSFCQNLERAKVGDNVSSLGAGAFYACSTLLEVTLGKNVTKIGSFVFDNCPKLKGINVSENNATFKSVDGNLYDKNGTTLMKYAVGKSANSFILPNGVTKIGERAFENATALESITIPATVTDIEKGAFAGAGIQTITIPNSVTKIGVEAFCGCTALESVIIGGGVTELGEGTFVGCANLKTLSIGSGLMKLESSALNGAKNLRNITVSEDNSAFKSVDGNLYNKDGKTLIKYAVGKTDNSFTLANGVTEIADYAFYGSKNLREATLSPSLEKIGDASFRECSALEEIVFGGGLITVGDYAFYASGLRSIQLPDSVKIVGDYAFFNCKALTEITLSRSLTTLGAWAFGWCRNLREIVIPETVTTMGERVFYYCFDTTIYCGAEEQPEGWSTDWNYNDCPVVWGE